MDETGVTNPFDAWDVFFACLVVFDEQKARAPGGM